MARGGDGGGLWAPEMKTKAERKDGGREDTANPDSFRGKQRRESGATQRRLARQWSKSALSAIVPLSLAPPLQPSETEGDFQLRLFRSNPLSFSDGRGRIFLGKWRIRERERRGGKTRKSLLKWMERRN